LQHRPRSHVKISAGVLCPIVRLRGPQVESAGGMEQAIPVATLELPTVAGTFL